MSITKGKWEPVENDHFIDIKVDGNPIAQVVANQYANVDKEQMRANARMMAPAPEILEAMQELVDRVERGEVRSVKAYSKFKSLLAKVNGDL
tara:strand:- start:40651 stop:40926 length:276 start_codon:yes stop_codon:yes gene_type:complete